MSSFLYYCQFPVLFLRFSSVIIYFYLSTGIISASLANLTLTSSKSSKFTFANVVLVTEEIFPSPPDLPCILLKV
jgi:hypothetical protein